MPATDAIVELDCELIDRLEARLLEPLPGRSAQRGFEPELSYGRHFSPPDALTRRAAVALLLYPDDGRWTLPLTVRPGTMPVHAGQISLPGGRLNPGETSQEAALRELEEELGVNGQCVRVVGRLSPLYLFNSGFLVEPWVLSAAARPPLRPCAVEVAELLEVPLAHLMDPASVGSGVRKNRGVVFSAPHFAWRNHRIWGATAMILGELVSLLQA